MLRITLAVLHLLALGIGLGAVYGRGRSANRLGESPQALRAAFAADNWWGFAALLWISTGLWRAFAGTEKASSYYWSNHVFYAKMGLLALIFVLELFPMITLMGWRKASQRGLIDSNQLARKGRIIARISDVQLLLVIGMVIAAVMMARGYGAR
jgi:putative membrane protein